MNVIIISAHPDDEILGAGGTLLRHSAIGDHILWLIATDVFEMQGFSKERIKSRHNEIKRVAEKLGIQKTVQLDFPTMNLTTESLTQLIPRISDIMKDFKPEIIYCPNRSDAHSDHRILFEAAWACSKSFRHPYLKQFLMYECISETEFAPALLERAFLPNYFIDVTKYHEKKLEIMKIYESELGEHPFPRSLRNMEALATFRGSIAGVEYAEAFQVLKYIDK